MTKMTIAAALAAAALLCACGPKNPPHSGATSPVYVETNTTWDDGQAK